ncbi:hypothetical protein AJ88_11980 [Mesorhizobium amorphae CCBAU 01583]|nr:hypothetical protein AJ88_11980 [Mesorhizobium amorphae CCBAU 01583]
MALLLPALVGAALLVAAAAALAWSWTSVRPGAPVTPRVLVENFDNLTGTQTGSAIAIGLKQEIVSQLSKFKDIVVMEPPANGGDISPPRFVLAGSVNLVPDAFWLRMRLINRADGSIVWSDSYNGGLKVADLVKAQADIASEVATSLAQAYGVIFQAVLSCASTILPTIGRPIPARFPSTNTRPPSNQQREHRYAAASRRQWIASRTTPQPGGFFR